MQRGDTLEVNLIDSHMLDDPNARVTFYTSPCLFCVNRRMIVCTGEREKERQRVCVCVSAAPACVSGAAKPVPW